MTGSETGATPGVFLRLPSMFTAAARRCYSQPYKLLILKITCTSYQAKGQDDALLPQIPRLFSSQLRQDNDRIIVQLSSWDTRQHLPTDDYRQIADTPGTALCCRYRDTNLSENIIILVFYLTKSEPDLHLVRLITDLFINTGLARDLFAPQFVHQKMFTFRRDARRGRLLIRSLEVEQNRQMERLSRRFVLMMQLHHESFNYALMIIMHHSTILHHLLENGEIQSGPNRGLSSSATVGSHVPCAAENDCGDCDE
ncbi:hypothetical protein G5I_00618 [Acromyrmex echinatior]|uniref:Uncharacterized protein n=1 Tax=Acromyrmex echinatior TaxID=103372 RepID=F4W5C2_ACREC|nr:hypothetical protein G5I_00618 [Acromyrmex echinatior]